MQEIWKEVKGYEDRYKISNFGNIRSKRKALTPGVTLGYKYVNLCKNGKAKSTYIHRLVAIAFLSNTENKPQVNHIDGDKQNNRIDNLEWCTQSENVKHAYDIGLKKLPKWELNPNSKLTAKEVIEIRNRYVKYCRQNGTVALAKEFGVSDVAIHEIVTNKKWKDVI